MNLETLLQNLFYLLLISKTLTQLILGVKNRRYMKAHYHKIPDSLKQSITPQQHHKAIDYHMAKSKLSKFQVQFDALFLIALIPFGLVNNFDDILQQYINTPVLRGLTFFAGLSFISTLLSLPFSWYQTFVIEEKFGFNNQTPKLFFIDLIKQLLLGSLIGLPILYVLLSFLENGTAYWWFYAFLSLVSFQFLLMWLYPRFIAPLFNKFTPLNNEELSQDISDLCRKTGFTSKSIEMMDASKRSSHGNAYFTGFGKNKKIVFYDTLLKNLSNNEILAVLAHELGHFAKKHILKMLIVSIIMSFLGFFLLGKLTRLPEFYSGHFIQTPSAYMSLFIFLNIIPLYTFFLSPLSSFISRKHEYEADAFAVDMTSAEDLSEALIKLQRDNSAVSTLDPHYVAFYYSHPPLTQRLKHIQGK